jgi:hypothetical protein
MNEPRRKEKWAYDPQNKGWANGASRPQHALIEHARTSTRAAGTCACICSLSLSRHTRMVPDLSCSLISQMCFTPSPSLHRMPVMAVRQLEHLKEQFVLTPHSDIGRPYISRTHLLADPHQPNTQTRTSLGKRCWRRWGGRKDLASEPRVMERHRT